MSRLRHLADRANAQLGALRDRHDDEHHDGGSWVMTCPCGTTVSMWDLGGLRARLSSKGASRTAVCPTCRQRFVGRVRRVPV